MLYLSSLFAALPNVELMAVPLGLHQPGVDFLHAPCGPYTLLTLETHSPIRYRVRLPKRFLLTGQIHEAGAGGWLDGHPLSAGQCFSVLPQEDGDVVLGEGTSLSAVLSPLDAGIVGDDVLALLRSRAQASPRGVCEPPPSAMTTGYENVRRAVLACTAESPQAAHALGLRDLVFRHLRDGEPSGERPMDGAESARCRYGVFQQAEACMLENLHKEIYLSELCEATAVSERTLRYAFDDVVGLSPTRYLSLLRLSSTYKDLVLSRSDRITVASVALKRGMWDLSRFAGSYHRAFGEYPSDTLKRRMAAIA